MVFEKPIAGPDDGNQREGGNRYPLKRGSAHWVLHTVSPLVACFEYDTPLLCGLKQRANLD